MKLLGLCLVFVSIPGRTAWAQPTRALALHPENAHYFLWRDDPTVLVTSGEHYGALLNQAFDYVRYFEELARHGLNHTRTFSGTYRETPASFGITNNTLAPRDDDFLAPWLRVSAPGETPRFDLNKWDSRYFQRLHEYMRAAGEHGIVVEMNLFCPMYRDEMWEVCPMNARNNINGIGSCPRTELLTLQHEDLTRVQLAVTRKLVEELRGYDNLYYEVCNEPYERRATIAWQHRIVDEIVAAEASLAEHERHLISQNIANGAEKVEQAHPDVSIFNFHYCVPPVAVAMNAGLNRVIGENETGFRGRDDVLYRTEGWGFLLAGGALYNNLDYSFTVEHPDGNFLEYRSPGGGSPALREQLGWLKRFVDGFDFLRMRPAPDVVSHVEPPLTTYALVEDGKQYAIYLHVSLPKKPERLSEHLRTSSKATLSVELPPGRYAVQWLDPVTGMSHAPVAFSHLGGLHRLSTPEFDNDIALRLVSDAGQ